MPEEKIIAFIRYCEKAGISEDKSTILRPFSPDKKPIHATSLSALKARAEKGLNIDIQSDTNKRIIGAIDNFFKQKNHDYKSFSAEIDALLKYRRLKMSYQPIPDDLAGWWILINWASVRKERADKAIPRALRVAYVHFHAAQENEASFEIHGYSTHFLGIAHILHNRIHAHAKENVRKREECFLVSHTPVEIDNEPCEIQGILTGVGLGQFERDGVLYSTAALLTKLRVASPEEDLLRKSLLNPAIRQGSLCMYLDPYNLSEIFLHSDVSFLDVEIRRALKSFLSLASNVRHVSSQDHGGEHDYEASSRIFMRID